MAILLVVTAGLSYRGAAKTLKIFFSFFPSLGNAPSHESIRLWVLKLGYHKLTQVREKAKDWALILDHTIQIGTTKVLIVLGIRLSRLPVGRPLTFRDVEPIKVIPMEHSNQDVVFEELEMIQDNLGPIRLLVADEGSDIKAGCIGFVETYADCSYVPDIAHKLANLLKAELKNDPSWKELTKRAADTRLKYQQTSLGYATPPNQRTKARYLNVDLLVRWAVMIFRALQSSKLACEERRKIFEAFGWVYGLSEAILEYRELIKVIALSAQFVRCYGIRSDTAQLLNKHLNARSFGSRAQTFSKRVVDFLKEQSKKAKENEVLLGSSEIMESLIGSEKHHAASQSRSGFTRSILIFGALAGELTEEVVALAMHETTRNDVDTWSQENLGPTVQQDRKKLFQNYGDKQFGTGQEMEQFIEGKLGYG